MNDASSIFREKLYETSSWSTLIMPRLINLGFCACTLALASGPLLASQIAVGEEFGLPGQTVIVEWDFLPENPARIAIKEWCLSWDASLLSLENSSDCLSGLPPELETLFSACIPDTSACPDGLRFVVLPLPPLTPFPAMVPGGSLEFRINESASPGDVAVLGVQCLDIGDSAGQAMSCQTEIEMLPGKVTVVAPPLDPLNRLSVSHETGAPGSMVNVGWSFFPSEPLTAAGKEWCLQWDSNRLSLDDSSQCLANVPGGFDGAFTSCLHDHPACPDGLRVVVAANNFSNPLPEMDFGGSLQFQIDPLTPPGDPILLEITCLSMLTAGGSPVPADCATTLELSNGSVDVIEFNDPVTVSFSDGSAAPGEVAEVFWSYTPSGSPIVNRMEWCMSWDLDQFSGANISQCLNGLPAGINGTCGLGASLCLGQVRVILESVDADTPIPALTDIGPIGLSIDAQMKPGSSLPLDGVCGEFQLTPSAGGGQLVCGAEVLFEPGQIIVGPRPDPVFADSFVTQD